MPSAFWALDSVQADELELSVAVAVVVPEEVVGNADVASVF